MNWVGRIALIGIFGVGNWLYSKRCIQFRDAGCPEIEPHGEVTPGERERGLLNTDALNACSAPTIENSWIFCGDAPNGGQTKTIGLELH